MEEAEQKDRENVFVDYASVAPSHDFGFDKCLDIGSVALACGTFGPNPGSPIRFSKVTVAIHESEPLRLEWRPPESDRIRSPTIADGHALMVGAGIPVWKRWATPRTIFAVALEEGFLGHIVEQTFDGPCDCAIETAIGIDDPVIRRLSTLTRRELDEGGGGGRLYIEGLGAYLAVHLLRRYRTKSRGPSVCKGGLTPVQLRRVIAYIDAHLGDELGLLELSSAAGLSPHHFGGAFKASTGTPPHRYVMERRVERARELLCDQGRALGEIAYAVGFSSQAHFTTQFRRATSMTPGRFRRSPA